MYFTYVFVPDRKKHGSSPSKFGEIGEILTVQHIIVNECQFNDTSARKGEYSY